MHGVSSFLATLVQPPHPIRKVADLANSLEIGREFRFSTFFAPPELAQQLLVVLVAIAPGSALDALLQLCLFVHARAVG